MMMDAHSTDRDDKKEDEVGAPDEEGSQAVPGGGDTRRVGDGGGDTR